mmetsp:Transcript_17932/g.36097  ORF Transcript_17932/g.36097 Transcript_17932/m.36097 type:complete len:105 (-) Transcript_17932:230-544(-)
MGGGELRGVRGSPATVRHSLVGKSSPLYPGLLGCEVVRDSTAKTLTFRQPAYIRRVLAAHGMTDCNPVKTPLEPGTRLSIRDCPATLESPFDVGKAQSPARLGG